MADGFEQRPGVELWSSTKWRAGAVAWLDEQLVAVGIDRVGEVERPYLRPWSTVLSAPTTRGRVWLKAGCLPMPGLC